MQNDKDRRDAASCINKFYEDSEKEEMTIKLSNFNFVAGTRALFFGIFAGVRKTGSVAETFDTDSLLLSR